MNGGCTSISRWQKPGKVWAARSKGQIKPKADWRDVDSPKKQTNEFVIFCHEKPKKKIFIEKLGKVVSFMIVPGNSTDSQ